jgi:hypothetical protein
MMKQSKRILIGAACIALCVTFFSCNNAFHEATGATSSSGGTRPGPAAPPVVPPGTPVQPPAAPGAPTLAPGDIQIGVSWAAVSGASAYEVWFDTGNDPTAAAQFGADVAGTTATITGLTNGTLYNVWVRAKNAGGTSAFSSSASGTPGPTLTVTGPTRTAFYVGESMSVDTSGYFAGITVIYTNNGATQDVTGSIAWTDPVTSVAGAKTITISYSGAGTSFTVNVCPVFIGTPGSGGAGYASLDDAFAAAEDNDIITLYANQTISNNTNPGGMTVTLKGHGPEKVITHNPGGRMFSLSGAGTTLILDQNITLDGQNDNNAMYPLVHIGSGSAFQMNNGSTIKGGKIGISNYRGGAVDNKGTFTMTGGTISGNTVGTTRGGGAVSNSGTFTMSGGTISGNSAGNGGAVINVQGTFTMSGGTISGNSAGSNGGGVYIENGTFTMTGGDINGANSATGKGGGVYIFKGTFNLNGPASLAANITGNTAATGDKVYRESTGTFNTNGGAAGSGTADGSNEYWN